MNKLRIFFKRVSWFLENYRRINTSDILIANNFLGPIKYNFDSVATSNNADFLTDPKFKRAYELASQTSPWKGFNMQWRTFIVCTLAEMVKNLEGDFVECGVNTGAFSRAIIDYIEFNETGKSFYLFDTYEGLVDAQITENERKEGIGEYLSTYVPVYDQVKSTFSGFNTKVIKGIVPESLSQFAGSSVCYLSIDMNVVAPEIAAANFFWDKLVKGGVMILDDYGFPAHINQKMAFDSFAKEKGVSILYIPTGQGIIFKN